MCGGALTSWRCRCDEASQQPPPWREGLIHATCLLDSDRNEIVIPIAVIVTPSSWPVADSEVALVAQQAKRTVNGPSISGSRYQAARHP
jgi:hypothetical protein